MLARWRQSLRGVQRASKEPGSLDAVIETASGKARTIHATSNDPISAGDPRSVPDKPGENVLGFYGLHIVDPNGFEVGFTAKHLCGFVVAQCGEVAL